ncbi:flagellar hook-associated protein 3 FlgL [Palleronia aestuarii]|uniref:Flagellin n=1 Tax=Palleronia aestuarii TaxID=568105 RepID=A0A2W7NQK5_9RHOB|nr:flagellin [Palleronia aestuarii]PZX18914.1 flagellar hook-associated protein 3 FlgL [Palleronia aestuarii]
MMTTTFGDLAQNFVQRRAITSLNKEMAQQGQEITTGIKADITSAMGGDTRSLASLERSLTGLEAYRTATTEAELAVDMVQTALGRIESSVSEVRNALSAQLNSGDTTGFKATNQIAKSAFENVVSTLNTSVSGRSLFAGTATNQPALRQGSEILADIKALVEGDTDPTVVSDKIDAYFNDPAGGFLTNDYLGSDQSRAAFRISPNDEVSVTVRADDAEMRETLAALAKNAVLADGAPNLPIAGQRALVDGSRAALHAADSALIGLRGTVGVAQAKIDSATTRNEAEKFGLEEARLAMIGADIYEATTRFQQIETQLQSLYAITARMSRLNLTNFL